MLMVNTIARIVILTRDWGAKPRDHPLAVRVEMEPIVAVNLATKILHISLPVWLVKF